MKELERLTERPAAVTLLYIDNTCGVLELGTLDRLVNREVVDLLNACRDVSWAVPRVQNVPPVDVERFVERSVERSVERMVDLCSRG